MVLIIFSIFCLFILIGYYKIFSKVGEKEIIHTTGGKITPISLIICAKNEFHNLQSHFDTWINQQHPQFELIIVNDGSTDQSSNFLQEKALMHSNFRFINISVDASKKLKGKRHALFEGIQKAKYDHLIFTDADCKPLHKEWLFIMSQFFTEDKKVILGYSPYEKKKGLLNQLIQFETVLTALQYLGWALNGKPYMGVGRNLGYEKALFTKEVFDKSNFTQSGDDDLIAQQLCNKENTVVCLNPKTFVESTPSQTFKTWMLQKTRHFKASHHYTLKFKILLGIFVFANIGLYFLVLGLIFFKFFVGIAIGLYIFKIIMFYIVLKKSLKTLYNSLTFKEILYLEIIYWLIFIIIQTLSIFLRNNGWISKKN